MIHPREHPRPYGFKKLLEAVKAEVSVERLAQDLGARLESESANRERRGYGVCHGGDNPTAFVVYTEQQRWHCFRCGESGDVLDLYQAVHSVSDRKLALVNLAAAYRVESPAARSESWHLWNQEKDRRTNMIRDMLAESYRRRYFRIFYRDYLSNIADSVEREREGRKLWLDLWQLAVISAEWRMTV